MSTPLGGLLIRRWSGFVDWMSQATTTYGHSWPVDDQTAVEITKVLAALGGPPASAQVRVRLSADAAGLLCLFLLLQPEATRTVIGGNAAPVMARVKNWIMLTAQGAVTLLGSPTLTFHNTVLNLNSSGAALRLHLLFSEEGTITGLKRPGGRADLWVDEEGGEPLPCDLYIVVGADEPPAVPPGAVGEVSPTAVALQLA